jgi:hypothetical protein
MIGRLAASPTVVLGWMLSLSVWAQDSSPSGIEYIDCWFENASPIWYETDAHGSVQIHLTYDHERSSPNRAAGHFHFRLLGKPRASVRLEFNQLDNIWNGMPGSLAKELKAAVVSDEGREWESIELFPTEDGRVYAQILLDEQGSKYIARVEPYRLSDLERFLQQLGTRQDVQITSIGRTVEGRPIEIVQVGSSDAKHRVFLRARAHPWEAGGNWVLEGLAERLLQSDDQAARWRRAMAFYILPMANKDGVARGRTRFNMKGKDLNRNWNAPADPNLAPENAALEDWLKRMISDGKRPDLAMELHNDGNGKLHISRPESLDARDHVQRMQHLESLLRRFTWFSEGSTNASFRNAGTLGEGWLERYHIDALVHEFNCNTIASLNQRPMARHWKEYGRQLPLVLATYFETRP